MKRNPQNSILFLLPSVKIGGGNRVVFELANGLIEKYRIAIWYPRGPGECYYRTAPGVQVRAIGLFGGGLIIRAINILLLFFFINLSASRFKHIISTGQMLGPLLLFIRRDPVYNFIQADDFQIFSDLALLRNNFFYGLYKILTFLSYRYPNVCYIFNSRHTYRRFLFNSKRDCIPPALVRPGVNPSVFNHSPGQNKTPGDKVHLVYLARFHPIKGLQTMITAFRHLPENIRQQLSVTIVTPDNLIGYDIPREWQLESPRNDTALAGIYNCSDVFVSTSLSEGFGLPALEAMACGCAVILSENGGCSEYARPGHNCLTYRPGDSRSLAKHIMRLVNDRNIRKHISAQGVITSKYFLWLHSQGELLRILNDGTF
jgi:glycosyltransferase involved in cell wall biosynthesis